MAKKDRGNSVSLDSFLDVLTCLQGVLMLVIISTGIDAAQTRVLIPTPIERESMKKVVYIECRGERMYPVDVDTLWTNTQNRMLEVAREAAGDQVKTLQGLTSPESRVTNEFFEVDLTYALLGQLALKPNLQSGAEGYAIDERAVTTTPGWINDILRAMDKDKERLKLIVRDDSYKVFKTVQRLAFLHKVEVSVEVFDAREPIRFSQLSKM